MGSQGTEAGTSARGVGLTAPAPGSHRAPSAEARGRQEGTRGAVTPPRLAALCLQAGMDSWVPGPSSLARSGDQAPVPGLCSTQEGTRGFGGLCRGLGNSRYPWPGGRGKPVDSSQHQPRELLPIHSTPATILLVSWWQTRLPLPRRPFQLHPEASGGGDTQLPNSTPRGAVGHSGALTLDPVLPREPHHHGPCP